MSLLPDVDRDRGRIKAFLNTLRNLNPTDKTEQSNALDKLMRSRIIRTHMSVGSAYLVGLSYLENGVPLALTASIWQRVYRPDLSVYAPGIIEILSKKRLTIKEVVELTDTDYLKFSLVHKLWIHNIVGKDILNPKPQRLQRYAQPFVDQLIEHGLLQPRIKDATDTYRIPARTRIFLKWIGYSDIASVLEKQSFNIEGPLYKTIDFFLSTYQSQLKKMPPESLLIFLLLLIIPEEKNLYAAHTAEFRSSVRQLVEIYNSIYLPEDHAVDEIQSQRVADYLIASKMLSEETFSHLNATRWMDIVLDAFECPRTLPLYTYYTNSTPYALQFIENLHRTPPQALTPFLKTQWVLAALQSSLVLIDAGTIQYCKNNKLEPLTIHDLLILIQLPTESVQLLTAQLVFIEDFLSIEPAICRALCDGYSAVARHFENIKKIPDYRLLVEQYDSMREVQSQCSQLNLMPWLDERAELLQSIQDVCTMLAAIAQYCHTPNSDLSRVKRLDDPIVQANLATGRMSAYTISLILRMEESKWQHMKHLPSLLTNAIQAGFIRLRQVIEHYEAMPLQSINRRLRNLAQYTYTILIRMSRSPEDGLSLVGQPTPGEGQLADWNLIVTPELLSLIYHRRPTPRSQEVKIYESTPADDCVEALDDPHSKVSSPLTQIPYSPLSSTPGSSILSWSTAGFTSETTTSTGSTPDYDQDATTMLSCPTVYGSPLSAATERPFPQNVIPGDMQDPEVGYAFNTPR